MPMITNEIESESGILWDCGRRACFSHLRDLNAGIGMITKHKWKSVEEDNLKYIHVFPDNLDKVGMTERVFYYRYLYEHKGWSTFFANPSISSMVRRGIVRCKDKTGAEILMAATAMRNEDELPNMLRSFYRMSSLDYVKNLDLAFVLSQFVHVNKDGSMSIRPKTRDIGVYNINHLMFNFSEMKVKDIIDYAAYFPYNTEGEPLFNENFKLNGVFNYFKRNKYGKNIYTSLFNISDKEDHVHLDATKFRKLFCKMQNKTMVLKQEEEFNVPKSK